MRPLWLVLDCNYLCWRAFYSTSQNLSWQDRPTGVMYGFFRDLRVLEEEFNPCGLVFCFDHGVSKRKELYPTYKSKRKVKDDPEEGEGRSLMEEQLHVLKFKTLNQIGYRNVLFQKGYEGDDLVASVVQNSLEGADAVIVSADKDLFQLLTPSVSIWNPFKKELVGYGTFRKRYGIDPDRWADMKAMAGCLTDGVKGIKGVGEKSALAYLQEELAGEKVLQDKNKRKLINLGVNVWKDNLKLVKLPFEGTKVVGLRQDNVDVESWNKVMQRWGMNSLRRVV